MKKQLFYIILLILINTFLVISCKNNSCSCNSHDGEIPDSYLPLTRGSYWIYQQNTNNFSVSIYDTVTNNEGKVYYCSNSLEDHGKFVDTEHNSYYVMNVTGLFSEIADGKLLNILNLNSAGQWQQKFGDTVIYKYSFIEKLKNKQVGSTRFNDIVHVEQQKYFVKNSSENLQDSRQYYFAKKVGLIEVINKDSTVHYKIIDYYIAPSN